jgi:alkanesulfonate monooxygenase SsuD/methylene tetrahydromethanopterin reductase-like flavin-dependent oxidoreductase (luciferase family)
VAADRQRLKPRICVSPLVDRQAIAAARAAIERAGFTPRGRAHVFVTPITEETLGWASFMVDRDQDRVLLISAKVGVRHEPLEELAGDGRSAAPTISQVLGYLMPQRSANVVWRFDAGTPAEPQAESLVDAISTYGRPYMTEHASLQAIAQELERSVPWEYSQRLLPGAYLLLGDPDRAREFLDRELAAQADRSDLAAVRFREVAAGYREEIERRLRRRL